MCQLADFDVYFGIPYQGGVGEMSSLVPAWGLKSGIQHNNLLFICLRNQGKLSLLCLRQVFHTFMALLGYASQIG